MTALIVLPGLDGTATLLAAFVEASRSSFDAVVAVSYLDALIVTPNLSKNR